MLKKYAIWDKATPIITPIGEVFTPEQWIERYPAAGLPNITVICGAGEINGAFFGTLGQMKQIYEAQGLDLSDYSSPEDILQAIEDFEDRATVETGVISPEERIASALELQNLLAMETVNDDDPDIE